MSPLLDTSVLPDALPPELLPPLQPDEEPLELPELNMSQNPGLRWYPYP